MKKILVTIVVTIIAFSSFGQWATSGNDIHNSNTGNVGIGTTSPVTNFDVATSSTNHSVISLFRNGSTGKEGLEISHTGANGSYGTQNTIALSATYYTSGGAFRPMSLVTSNTSRLYIEPGGNIAIGNTSPFLKFDVSAGSTTKSAIALFRNGSTYGEGLEISHTGSDGGYGTTNSIVLAATYYLEGGVFRPLALVTANLPRLYIEADGDIGIGRINPGDYKLAVNGHIRAKEIKVETPWSDFVFEPGYKLRSLKETEQYIKKNGHLPDIPSTKEVEANGISLGELNAKLLQKTKELTLHLIEQGKELNKLRSEINQLR